MTTISVERILAQVRDFWSAFSSKSSMALEEMYFPSAVVFSYLGQRSEPARLMLVRRLRKFSSQVKVAAEVSQIDAQIAGDVVIVSYPYHFRSLNAQADGGCSELNMPYARATHVLAPDNGVLRILHEHFSVAEPGKKTHQGSDAAAIQTKAMSQLHSGMSGMPSVRMLDMGPLSVAKISVDEVQSFIRKTWQSFQGKSKEAVDAAYFPTAIFWELDARRSESARLAIMRRAREFFGPRCSLSVELGPVEVQMTGSSLAVASYTFQFRAIRQTPNGKRLQQDVPGCRATTIVMHDELGDLRILHEHQSAMQVGSIKELAMEQADVIAQR